MNAPNPQRPVDGRHFEDYVPGASAVFGPIPMTEADIIEFARRYDPQPIHVDPVAATAGPFGGLIASGWHTVVVGWASHRLRTPTDHATVSVPRRRLPRSAASRNTPAPRPSGRATTGPFP